MKEVDSNGLNELYENSNDLDMFSQDPEIINDITFKLNIPPILIKSKFPHIHYLCPKCNFFPLINFINKERKTISYICSCEKKNKEIGIIDLFNRDNNYLLFNDKSNSNNFNENIFKCKMHETFNKVCKFRYYCSKCHKNLCKICCQNHFKKNHNLLNFDFLNSDTYDKTNKIIEILNLEKIKENNIESESDLKENNNESFKIDFENEDEGFADIIEKECNYFNELIIIIINDYLKYPNYSHFSNIDNIFHFLKKEKVIIFSNNDKSFEQQISLNKSYEESRLQDLKELNKIKQIQVESLIRIEEAKLKGEIEVKKEIIQNQKKEISYKHNEEILKIIKDTVKLNKEYKLKNIQEENKHDERIHKLKNEQKKIKDEIELKYNIENIKHEETLEKLKNENDLNILKMKHDFILKQIELQYKYENQKEINKMHNIQIQGNLKNESQRMIDKKENEILKIQNEHEINKKRLNIEEEKINELTKQENNKLNIQLEINKKREKIHKKELEQKHKEVLNKLEIEKENAKMKNNIEILKISNDLENQRKILEIDKQKMDNDLKLQLIEREYELNKQQLDLQEKRMEYEIQKENIRLQHDLKMTKIKNQNTNELNIHTLEMKKLENEKNIKMLDIQNKSDFNLEKIKNEKEKEMKFIEFKKEEEKQRLELKKKIIDKLYDNNNSLKLLEINPEKINSIQIQKRNKFILKIKIILIMVQFNI